MATRWIVASSLACMLLACGSAAAEPVGACCFNSGGFQQCMDELPEADCLSGGGTWLGPGIDCDSYPCAGMSGWGACCRATGFGGEFCTIESESSCTSSGGTWQGANTACEGLACDQPWPACGACCMSWGCLFMSQYECEAYYAGNWLGDGTHCSDLSCPGAEFGACCLTDQSCGTTYCLLADQEGCMMNGGVPHGVGVLCTEVNCGVVVDGACCVGSACLINSAADCFAMGGLYLGDDTTCDDTPCQLGACCVGEECYDVPEMPCITNGGAFLGTDVLCVDDPCYEPPTRPCCIEDVCIQAGLTECTDAGGLFHSTAELCAEVQCYSSDRACCLDGQCIVLSQEQCNLVMGTFLPDEEVCDWAFCGGHGACCMDGTCVHTTEVDCLAAGGWFYGPYTECEWEYCESTVGACCVGTGCAQVSQATCDLLQGHWLGVGGDCASCPPPCEGDVNSDGVVNVDDLMAVIGSWGPC